MRNKGHFAFISAVAGLAIAATPAFATTMDNFTVSEPSTSTTITFSLPSSPTPSSFTSTYFDMTGVDFSVNGGAPVVGQVFFFNSPTDGLYLDITTPNVQLFDEESASLFTGLTSAPTFNLGTFDGVDDSHTSYTIAVTIGDPPPVPEPNSLALLGTGMLGILGAAKRRLAA